MKRWLLLLVSMVALAAVLFGFGMVGGRQRHQRPICTSGMSTIRVVGNHTERGPTVWFPKGCRHD
ncbi:MAG TPA: hypothetical protein VL371_15805 [Gemmataceae bacterium]|jgi:hypothetical protein|nr:hypothetical protein [Gemmataceae bacterium]